MSTQSIKAGLQQIQEIILDINSYSMSVSASTQEVNKTLAHGLGLTPFYDYDISVDDGSTFYPPNQILTIDSNILIQMFSDNQNLYFNYSWGNGFPANPSLSIIYRYKLYITEATT